MWTFLLQIWIFCYQFTCLHVMFFSFSRGNHFIMLSLSLAVVTTPVKLLQTTKRSVTTYIYHIHTYTYRTPNVVCDNKSLRAKYVKQFLGLFPWSIHCIYSLHLSFRQAELCDNFVFQILDEILSGVFVRDPLLQIKTFRPRARL